ncbi:MAG: hypothetical protein ABW221_05240 [Vicinamibacteria bacterium]
MSVAFCTLAIHAPYRRRARALVASAPAVPWVVLTDRPDDFADLPARVVRHQPTGPMAADYLRTLPPTGQNRGAAAYHDKRFAVAAALRHFETALFVDADSRIETEGLAALPPLPPGLCALPVVRRSVAEHLAECGSWRLPAFAALARELTGSEDVLAVARWCHETCYAVTRDGREPAFLEAWDRAAVFLQHRGVYSGEGGVMGIAAACAGWTPELDALAAFGARVAHEGGGPKLS